MSKKRLAIYDDEKLYSELLGEMLENDQSFPFEVVVYSDEEKLISGIENGKINIVLAGCGLCEKINSTLNTEGILIIEFEENRKKKSNGIYKYQSVFEIKNQLIELYEKNAASRGDSVYNGNCLGRRKTEIIGIYSPVRSEVPFYAAFNLAQTMADSDMGETLFLNFEAFSYEEQLMGGNIKGNRNLSDLLYLTRSGGEGISLKFGLIEQSFMKLKIILPVSEFEDLESVTSEDWIKLMEAVRDMGLFDYVIIYFSDFIRELPKVLNECDRLFIPMTDDYRSIARTDIFLNNLKNADWDELVERLIKVVFPGESTVPDPRNVCRKDYLEIIRKKMIGGLSSAV